MAISTLVVALTARTTDFERSLKSAEKTLDRTAGSIERLGARMSAGLTAPIAALAAASGKFAVDFGQPFDQMQAVLAQSREQVALLQEGVLKLAGQTAQAPKDLAQALYDVQAGGVRGAQALEVLTAAAQAGAVGLGKTGTIAGILTAQLQAYGPHALTAAQTTDVLLGAVQRGAKSADALAENMGKLLPIAAEAGIPFNDLAAALTATTRNGLEAAQSTMGLQAVMTTILNPSTQAKAAMAQMGLSAAGLRQELREKGLLATLQSLQAAFKGNDEALTQVFPSARSLGAVLSLLGSNAHGVEGIFRDLADVTQNRLGAAMRKTAADESFKLEQAMIRVQVALIRLGQDILPVLVPLVERFGQAIADLSGRYRRLDAGSKDLAVVLVATVAAVGPLMLGFSMLYSAAATLLGVFRLLIGMTGLASLFSAVWAGVVGLAGALGELIALFKAFGAAETIAEVILPALGASALLAAGLMALAAYLWISKWQELKTDMGVIVDFIEEKLAILNPTVRSVMDGLYVAMNPMLFLLGKMKTALQDDFDGVAAGVTAAGAQLKTGFMSEVAGLETGLKSALGRMLANAKAMAAGILGSAKGMGAGATLDIPTVPNSKGGAVPKEDIQAQITLWENFSARVSNAIAAPANAFKAYKDRIGNESAAIASHLQGMVDQSASSMGAMTAAFIQGKQNIGQFVQGMIQMLQQLIIKMIIFAVISKMLGSGYAAGFAGAMNIGASASGGGRARGGRVEPGVTYMVGEEGPEPFIPDTAGTIIPFGARGAGGTNTVVVQQTLHIAGLDLGSQDAARRLAVALKDHARSGAAEGQALALQLAQTAQKNAGRAI